MSEVIRVSGLCFGRRYRQRLRSGDRCALQQALVPSSLCGVPCPGTCNYGRNQPFQGESVTSFEIKTNVYQYGEPQAKSPVIFSYRCFHLSYSPFFSSAASAALPFRSGPVPRFLPCSSLMRSAAESWPFTSSTSLVKLVILASAIIRSLSHSFLS
jgi:hypothetical protein